MEESEDETGKFCTKPWYSTSSPHNFPVSVGAEKLHPAGNVIRNFRKKLLSKTFNSRMNIIETRAVLESIRAV